MNIFIENYFSNCEGEKSIYIYPDVTKVQGKWNPPLLCVFAFWIVNPLSVYHLSFLLQAMEAMFEWEDEDEDKDEKVVLWS